LVNKLSPARFASLMFAIWFGASAIGNYFAGLIGSLYPESRKSTELLGWKISNLSDYFLLSALLPLIAGILLFSSYPLLKKWMHGVK
jgi:POT family proton-dependent oligopeptide transporter